MRRHLILTAALVVLGGCKDKAEPDFLRGQQLQEKGDMEGAVAAYKAAEAADPKSKKGKEAAERAAKIRGCLDDRRWRAKAIAGGSMISPDSPSCDGLPPETPEERAAAEAEGKAAVEAERRKAEAERRGAEASRAAAAEGLTAAREVVRAEWYGTERDGECAGKGYPPYRVDFLGGTFAQNEMVATSKGCVHLFEKHSTTSPTDNVYCCPCCPPTKTMEHPFGQ